MLERSAFESEADALAAVGVQLSRRLADIGGVPPTAWADILPAATLTDRIPAQDSATPATSAPAMLRRYRYVIRTDDLKLVESLLDSIKVLVPTGMLFPVSQPAAAAGAIGTIVVEGLKLLKRATRARASTNEASPCSPS